MQGFIALALLLVSLFIVLGTVFAWYRRRRVSGRQLSDLSPVSTQWLADRRRSG